MSSIKANPNISRPCEIKHDRSAITSSWSKPVYLAAFLSAFIFHGFIAVNRLHSQGSPVDTDRDLPLLNFMAAIDSVEAIAFDCSIATKPASPLDNWPDHPKASGWKLGTECSTLFELKSQRSRQEQRVRQTEEKGGKVKEYNVVYAFNGTDMFLRNDTAKEGLIDWGKDRESMPPIYGPLRGWGFLIMRTSDYVKGISIWDLFDRCEIHSLGSNKYVFKRINRAGDGKPGSYDLEVTLDPEHGYVPSRLELKGEWQGAAYTKTIVESSDFFQAGGVWLPEVVTVSERRKQNGKTQVTPSWRIYTDPASVEINPPVDNTSFSLDLGPDIEYTDFKTGERYNLKPESKNRKVIVENPVGTSWLTMGAIAAMLIGAVLLMKRKFKASSIAIVLASASTLGCREQTVPAVPNSELAILTCEEPLIRRDIEAGRIVDDTVTFTLTNATSERCEIGKLLSSCGCTAARPSKTSIDPGETIDVVANVRLPNFVDQKLIRLKVPIVKPIATSYELAMAYHPIADWIAQPTSIQANGRSGRKISCETTVQLRRGINDLHLTCPDNKFDLQLSQTRPDAGALSIAFDAPPDAGEYKFEVPIISNYKPKKFHISVLCDVQPYLSWSKKVVAIPAGTGSKRSVSISYPVSGSLLSVSLRSGSKIAVDGGERKVVDGIATQTFSLRKNLAHGDRPFDFTQEDIQILEAIAKDPEGVIHKATLRIICQS
ncbi:DUF1573 domain-containing protein [Roseiconus lacunae]|uniref:DUF1573 domain-containing protein n=1 Tax=Roseiconus lacunae TaxID=2605694 RepID=UPI003092D6DE|nr:DUF1573 domain-containing protein [Stieleria sp. HD01]